MDALVQLFSYFCGQAHTWAPGGELLPFCQRCTGLYVGGAFAMLAWVLFRPRPGTLVLWVHGLLMLAMIPFGYHLVPHGGIVRTITGYAFAIGLVYYLALNPAQRLNCWRRQARGQWLLHALLLLAGLCLLLLAVTANVASAATPLAWLGLAGAAGYAVLFAANLLVLPSTLWRLLVGKSVCSSS